MENKNKEGRIKAVSFDLWGVILDKPTVGEIMMESFREYAEHIGRPDEEIERIVADYNKLCRGTLEDLSRKGEIIDALEGPLKANNVKIDYSKGFYQGALDHMSNLLDKQYGVVIITTKPWDKSHLPDELSTRMGKVYHGDKKEGSVFEVTNRELNKQNMVLGGHIDDDINELLGALPTVGTKGLLYVVGNNKKVPDEVIERGISYTTTEFKVFHNEK